MALLLEKTQSSYYPAFKELYQETYNALQEALEIDSCLMPVLHRFELLRNGEYLYKYSKSPHKSLQYSIYHSYF